MSEVLPGEAERREAARVVARWERKSPRATLALVGIIAALYGLELWSGGAEAGDFERAETLLQDVVDETPTDARTPSLLHALAEYRAGRAVYGAM